MNEQELIEFLKNNLRLEIDVDTVYAGQGGEWYSKDHHHIKLYVKDQLVAEAKTHKPEVEEPKRKKAKPVSYSSIKKRTI